MRDVSGSLHRHDENCRQSQALSALPHENWGTSQALCTPHDEHCRPSQALSTPPHGNWGTSQAACAPHHKIADSLRLWGTFCALRSPKLGDVSGSVHPHGENCRQSQALSAPPHENWGTSQAFYTPHDENCRPSQALSTPPHGNWGTSQALCTPLS